ncbi:PREDICTED: ribonuclease 1-like [Prunus mume]|uniref:Ribonuclease 1-like n=1 Tax=Prunus mume TaxID=102107 RepID=A0ABM0PDJ9_PRUMU|nr:PREDICTED: ribonuclease 1-like [Prunus mume]
MALYLSGNRPTNCKSKCHFSLSKMSNLTKSLGKNWPSLSCPSRRSEKLWKHEWQKYETCSEELFGGQYQYFHAALNLLKTVDILKLLSDAGIHPNGSFYSASAVYSAIQSKVTHMPGIACNEDKTGNKQLYQFSMCGETAGTKIVDCLGLSSHGKCSEKIKFPSF